MIKLNSFEISSIGGGQPPELNCRAVPGQPIKPPGVTFTPSVPTTVAEAPRASIGTGGCVPGGCVYFGNLGVSIPLNQPGTIMAQPHVSVMGHTFAGSTGMPTIMGGGLAVSFPFNLR
jgi:hypothetical protein